MKNPERYANERRMKYPGRSQAIDAGRSPTGAIEEMCRECMSQVDCSDCTDTPCWLFPYRPGADKPGAVQRAVGDVPSQEEYEAMRKALDPDGSKTEAMRERFEAARAARNQGSAQGSSDDDFIEGVPV